ncbi:MAG: phospholipase D-like domain-containing protein [Candidatus Babeliales bacterium]|jgi:phosphatidylserine/phosphatidylglycerophosphate/cardiolipin synthase-like enzyme
MSIKKIMFLLALLFDITVLSMPFKARCAPFSSAQKNLMKETVFDLIDNAKKSLLVSMFTFTDKQAARKLSLAKARGVRVRVVMDHASSSKKYFIKDILEEFDIPTSVYKKSDAINHNKYVVVDDNKVWMSSMNWTDAAYHRNCESGILLYSRAIASFYEKDFKHTETLIKHQYKNEIAERKKFLKEMAAERKKHKDALAKIKSSKKR